MGKRGSSKAARREQAMAAGAGQSRSDQSRSSGLPAVTAAGGPAEADSDFSHSMDEIAMVRRATEVLGMDHVAQWMRSSIPSLGNQTPYSLIKTADGRGQVERVLLKIEHGVY
jgi:hypothetical protein